MVPLLKNHFVSIVIADPFDGYTVAGELNCKQGTPKKHWIKKNGTQRTRSLLRLAHVHNNRSPSRHRIHLRPSRRLSWHTAGYCVDESPPLRVRAICPF